jgi:hypothetical protein
VNGREERGQHVYFDQNELKGEQTTMSSCHTTRAASKWILNEYRIVVWAKGGKKKRNEMK